MFAISVPTLSLSLFLSSAELQAVDPGPPADAWRAFVQVVAEAGSGIRVVEPQSLENALAVVPSDGSVTKIARDCVGEMPGFRKLYETLRTETRALKFVVLWGDERRVE